MHVGTVVHGTNRLDRMRHRARHEEVLVTEDKHHGRGRSRSHAAIVACPPDGPRALTRSRLRHNAATTHRPSGAATGPDATTTRFREAATVEVGPVALGRLAVAGSESNDVALET
jgi:hypothetical protein